MSVVAGALGNLATRVDRLQHEVSRISKAQSTETADKEEPSLQTAMSKLESLRADLDDLKGGQTATFKKERGITEAVLSQKLERLTSERISAATKAANDAAGSAAPLKDRVNAIAEAVDKQARFVDSLSSKIDRVIASTVDRAISAAVPTAVDKAISQMSDNNTANQAGTQTAHNSQTALEELEDSPALDSGSSSLPGKDTKGDEIEMISRTEDTAAANKKGRGGARKKT